MDKLQWFKFTPTDWIMGKIQRCPEITQARFMRLICLYWNKECLLSKEDAEIEIDKEHLDILIAKKIIKIEDDFLIIQFLNEQLENISETSQKRREAVLQRWARVKQNDTSVSKNDTSVLQSDTDKSREELEKELEKKREEQIREDFTEISVPEILKKTRFDFKKKLLDYGFEKKLVEDWLLVRKNKKATNTETAFESFISEVEKRECNINEVLKICVENSWSGFKHVWVDNLNKNNLANGTSKSNEQIFRDAMQSPIAKHDFFK
jgi:hypothetical protein